MTWQFLIGVMTITPVIWFLVIVFVYISSNNYGYLTTRKAQEAIVVFTILTWLVEVGIWLMINYWR